MKTKLKISILGLITLLGLTNLNATATKKYTNCKFKEVKYTELCEELVKRKVSHQYANEFILSDKTDKRDPITLKLFKPKMISHHKKQEKKANNALMKQIPKLVKHLKEYKEVYDYTEKKYKVNREVIGSVLLKETHIGAIPLKHDAFTALNSLYMELEPDTKRNKRLISMGKNNNAELIKHCYKNKISVSNCNFPSSYAGATGIPQFMPMNFWLIEGYKTKLGNLNKMEDAIVSAGKYLNKMAKFKELIDWNKFKGLNAMEQTWYDFQFKEKGNYFLNKKDNTIANIKCFTCGNKRFNYLNKYVKSILKYNNSTNYALGVLSIANEANKELSK